MVNKRYLPVYIIYSIEREGENVGSGVFCMPFDSFANNVFLAKGNEQQVDFFIHGYTKFKVFGSDVYLTTTHISMIIVIAALLIFAVFANRAIRKATPDQVPGPFLNVVELIVESLDGMVAGSMGESKAPKFRFVFIYFGVQLVRFARATTADSRLRCHISVGDHYLGDDSIQRF